MFRRQSTRCPKVPRWSLGRPPKLLAGSLSVSNTHARAGLLVGGEMPHVCGRAGNVMKRCSVNLDSLAANLHQYVALRTIQIKSHLDDVHGTPFSWCTTSLATTRATCQHPAGGRFAAETLSFFDSKEWVEISFKGLKIFMQLLPRRTSSSTCFWAGSGKESSNFTITGYLLLPGLLSTFKSRALFRLILWLGGPWTLLYPWACVPYH